MKRFLLVFCFFQAVTINAQSWLPQSSGTTAALFEVEFIGADTGYAAGESGTMLHTTDGGATWTIQYTGAWYIQAMQFFNGMKGYFAGNGGEFGVTQDGGISWTTFLTATTNDLRDMHFIDENLGYMAGHNGTIIKTTNGGTSWSTLSTGTSEHLYGIHFFNATDGIAAGNGGTIIRTTNGGSTWSPVSSGTTVNITFLSFYSATSGSAGLVNGSVLVTNDGGLNWSEEVTGSAEPSFEGSYTPNGKLYIAGGNYSSSDGIIQRSGDGGSTWSTDFTQNVHRFLSVQMATNHIGYAVGNNGIIYKTSNAQQGILTSEEIPALKVYPNPANNGCFTVSSATAGNQEVTIRIFDTTGKCVFSIKYTARRVK
jgi:photosystem II stability/assembly factor-like uncharacterized protein